MKVEVCSACGQYHDLNSDCDVEATSGRFEKIRRQRDFDSSPPKEKEKGFRRPPVDKSLKWEYIK